VDVRDAWRRTPPTLRRPAYFLKAAVRAARKPNPFNTLGRFRRSAGFALCCGPRRADRTCRSAYCQLGREAREAAETDGHR
jgi:hypothetical protein